MWLKRFEIDKWCWPKNAKEALEINEDRLKMLFNGIDFWNAHQEIKFSEIAENPLPLFIDIW